MDIKNFEKNLNDLKGGLNDFISPETDKATIDKIASFSTLIDNLQAEYNSVKGEYDELKGDYIKVVKHASFKVDHDPKEDVVKKNESIRDITARIFNL